MNTTKISELPKFAISTDIAADDFIPIIDTSDITLSTSGNNKTATVGILSEKITTLITPAVIDAAETKATEVADGRIDPLEDALNDVAAIVNAATTAATENTLVLRNANGGGVVFNERDDGSKTVTINNSGSSQLQESFALSVRSTGDGAAAAEIISESGTGALIVGGGDGIGAQITSGSGTGADILSNSGTGAKIYGGGDYHALFGSSAGSDRSFVTRVKGAFGWFRGNFTGRIQAADELTANHTYILPDASGTIALVAPDNLVSAATTLTDNDYDKTFVCSGSTDYVVQLPTATNSGKLIHFRMDSQSALSAFVTIRAAGGQTIDGESERVMWALETATLRSTSSGWTKVAGQSFPLRARITNQVSGTGQSIASGQEIEVNLGLTDFNSIGMVNTNTIAIRRKGLYSLQGNAYLTNPPLPSPAWSSARVLGRIKVNGAAVVFSEVAAVAGSYPTVSPQASMLLNKTDSISLMVQHFAGVVVNLEIGKSCFLSAVEIPTW